MTLPVAPVERPLDLIAAANGQLSSDLLTGVGTAGLLHHYAARSWRALQAAAKTAGFSLTYTYGGTYRTLAAQEQLFLQRYTTTYLAGRPTKAWRGQTWYQLPNTAMAAVPGTSNHGLGLAVDTAIGSDPAHATSISPRLDWMAVNAPRFGWSWETVSENWHIRYVTGDHIPVAVLAYEGPQKPAPATPPAPPIIIEDDMSQSDTIVTNSEQFFDSAPGVSKFLLLANGKLRHLDYLEWATRGSDPGHKWANADIGKAGVVS